MAKKEKDILKNLAAPWITKDGFIDMAKIPIEPFLNRQLVTTKRISGLLVEH